MWIEISTTAILFLAMGGVLLGLFAHKRGLNPWMWGGISIVGLFLALLLPINGLLSLLIGGGVMATVIYMMGNEG